MQILASYNYSCDTHRHSTRLATGAPPLPQVLAPARTCVAYYNADTHTHWQPAARQQQEQQQQRPNLSLASGDEQVGGPFPLYVPYAAYLTG